MFASLIESSVLSDFAEGVKLHLTKHKYILAFIRRNDGVNSFCSTSHNPSIPSCRTSLVRDTTIYDGAILATNEIYLIFYTI